MEIFKFHTIKNAPNFCKYFYIPMMLIFLLTCLTGGIYFIVFSILSRLFALIICFVAVVAVGIVPLFYLLSAFNCELIIEENQIKYINWRRKKYTIEINYLNIVLTPIGNYGIWIKDKNNSVILKIYGIQWSTFFQKEISKSPFKREI